MVKYDEFGRPIEKAAKPRKPEWYEADSPKTFAISIVNAQTAEGVKDWWSEDKLKTAKGALKKAWKEGSGMAFQPAMPIGVWLGEQNRDDLYLVARPITVNRDREQYRETGIQVFSFSGSIALPGMAWNKAMEYVSSPPSGPQRFMEKEVGPRSPTTFGDYESTGYHGESTIIPLLDIAGE
jgi:hypothetical protein